MRCKCDDHRVAFGRLASPQRLNLCLLGRKDGTRLYWRSRPPRRSGRCPRDLVLRPGGDHTGHPGELQRRTSQRFPQEQCSTDETRDEQHRGRGARSRRSADCPASRDRASVWQREADRPLSRPRPPGITRGAADRTRNRVPHEIRVSLVKSRQTPATMVRWQQGHRRHLDNAINQCRCRLPDQRWSVQRSGRLLNF